MIVRSETFRVCNRFGKLDGASKQAILAAWTIALFFAASACDAGAHTLPWRTGESRMKGFGTCAKGPCMKRYDFSESKPHRHVSPGKCGVVDMRGDPLSVSEDCRQARRLR